MSFLNIKNDKTRDAVVGGYLALKKRLRTVIYPREQCASRFCNLWNNYRLQLIIHAGLFPLV